MYKGDNRQDIVGVILVKELLEYVKNFPDSTVSSSMKIRQLPRCEARGGGGRGAKLLGYHVAPGNSLPRARRAAPRAPQGGPRAHKALRLHA